MTTHAATSYVPRDVHQPRGKRPWCANCDTDQHLMVEFPGITGRQAGSLAVAVHCSQCSVSRVLDTTLDHVAALPSRLSPQTGASPRPTRQAAPRKPPMKTARTFESIVIIFNPNSTGDAPTLAEQLRSDLEDRLPYAASITLQPTGHAGHAVELARDAARGGGNVLVISVSGDGGYNEVVNGVMQAGNPDAVCAVMAAGNANDHRRTTGTQPLEEAIASGSVRHIDLLRISTGDGPDAPSEYAHSYIGFGLTPVMAIDLEKGSKGALKEMVSVMRTFSKFKPFEIRHTEGRRRKFDSLVFANIAQMAKYATLSEADHRLQDGKFEVVTFPHRSKLRILLTALRAATRGLGDQPSVSSYGFTTLKPIPYQIDGEVKSVDADTAVTIRCAPAALATLG
ncbi:diacylglycerol/lipid kinase family protein [Pseudarthrobacter scleromae]|uniref:diacylglycerol/lipid kinase family protein n=1 Tax=Pseudarthrobacter scleromae TaxID=158897 RepID=UPI003632E193